MKKFVNVLIVVSVLISMFFVTSVNAMTASELSGKLQTLKSQYPNGTHQTKFYNSIYSGDGTACYRDLSGHSSWECMAWARKVYDSLWGKSVSNGQFHQNASNLYVGDYIRYNSGSYDHSILVTNIVNNTVYYTDCNLKFDGKIQWDRQTTISDLQTKVNKKLNYSTSGRSYGHIVHYPENTIKTLSATTQPSVIHINFDANGGSLDTNGKAHFYADAVNTDRRANQIVVYTNGSSTGTNEYGIEYIVNKYGIVTEAIYGVGNAKIPEGGFVISGHGEAVNRLSSNIQVGDYAYYNMWYEDLITIYAPKQGLAAQKWVVNGEKYGDLPIPTKSGYEFAGWFTDVVGRSQITSDSTVNITAEQTLYAHWEVKTYRVNYDVNGGTLDGSTKVYFYADAVNTDRGANQIVVYTNGSSTGTNEYGIEYIVNKYGIITEVIYGVGNAKIPEGGFVISGHGEAINRLSSNIEVGDYAYFNKWYLNKISIYKPEQGIVAQKWVVNGEKYGDLPIPTKKGYEFAGWFINDLQEVTSDTIVETTEDVTLYAHWTLTKPHTATTITNNLFTIECSNIENGNMVILSLYKDKKFVKLYNEIYQGEDIPFTVTEEYDEAKVMVWKDLSALKPITDVEIVK